MSSGLPPCDTVEDWRVQHNDAVLDPTFRERPVVHLMSVAQQLTNMHADDPVLRVAAVHALLAMRVLLDGDLGRLDGGTVADFISRYMRRCNFDPETERFTE